MPDANLPVVDCWRIDLDAPRPPESDRWIAAPEHARALQIGQWLHLGKNTTFGLGRYTLTEQP